MAEPLDDPALALQGAIVAALAADAALADLVGERIYDEPPIDAVHPYVVIGDGELIDDSTDCVDSFEAYSFVDVWTREPGYPSAKRIAARVRKLLARELVLGAPYVMLLGRHEQTQFMRDPDPSIRRARLTFHHLISRMTED